MVLLETVSSQRIQACFINAVWEKGSQRHLVNPAGTDREGPLVTVDADIWERAHVV